MGWFSRRKEAEQASLITAMATAFGTALAGVLGAQAQQIEQSTKFLGTVQDLSAKQVMRAMGSRGGTSTAKRKKARKEAEKAVASCVLCLDPMHRGTTLEQINFHRQHETSPQVTEAQGAEQEQGN